MKITFKPKILLKYQSYDQKKCLAQWQNIWMFSLLTMFKTQIVKKFCTSKKKGPFHKSLRGLLFSITFFRTHFTPVYEKKVSCCKPHWSDYSDLINLETGHIINTLGITPANVEGRVFCFQASLPDSFFSFLSSLSSR